MGAKTHRVWTPEEDFLILNSSASAKELAAVLGRTVNAVFTRRAKLRKETLKSQPEIQESLDKQHRWRAAHEERARNIQELTAGRGYTQEQVKSLMAADKDGLDIAPMLNPAFDAKQLREITSGLKSGIDVGLYADPKYDHGQMVEIRLGLEHGINTEWYENPAFSCAAMRQIRYGLECGLAVQYYANPCYTCNQMEQLRQALRERLPVWKIANPAYTWEQMKVLRSALNSNIDITTFANPAIPAAEMKRRFRALQDKYRAVYLTRSERPKPSGKSLVGLDSIGEPFVIHCRSDAHAKEFLKRLEDLGYSWGALKMKSPGTLAGLYFQCFPKEKRVRSNQNKPKNGDFTTYLALKENAAIIEAALPDTENWVSCTQSPPPSAGLYLCLVRDMQTGVIQERMLEYRRTPEGQLRFLKEPNESVLTWKPHISKEKRYQIERGLNFGRQAGMQEEECQATQAFTM